MSKENFLRRTNLKGGKLCLGANTFDNHRYLSGSGGVSEVSYDSLKLRRHISKFIKSYGLKTKDFGRLLRLCGLNMPILLTELSEIDILGFDKVKAFKAVQNDGIGFYVVFDKRFFEGLPKKTDFALVRVDNYSEEDTLFNQIYNYYHIEVISGPRRKEKFFTIEMTESNLTCRPCDEFERFSLRYTYTDTSIIFEKNIRRTDLGKRFKYRFKIKLGDKNNPRVLRNNIDVLEAYFACIHEDLEHEDEIDNLLNILEFTNRDVYHSRRVYYQETKYDYYTYKRTDKYTFDYESDGESAVFKVYAPGYPIDISPNFRSSKYFEEDSKFLAKAVAYDMVSGNDEFDQRLLNWCILTKKKYLEIPEMLMELGFSKNMLLTYTGKERIYKIESEKKVGKVSFGEDGKITLI